jgi:8-oxo-dGTP pyrophosphatase MutT (NUDIX family)
MTPMQASSETAASLRAESLRAMLLRQQLEQFVAADAREEEFRARMLALLDTAEDPFSRDHYGPGHFTASSFVLAPDQRSLLLIFHSKLQRWLQPGGHVDPSDEALIAAARREVLEETGISELDEMEPGLFDLDIHTIPARGVAPKHEHFDLRYAFRAKGDACRAGSDAMAARWVPIDQVHQVESDESVQRALRKLVR